MKLSKLIVMAVVAGFALWAAKAGAVPAFFVFEKLNFSLTASQQGLDNVQTSPNVVKSTISTFRINSKDLLNLLGTALNTNWPTGAQLALDNVSLDMFVVDKTGTNPVFDLSTGINVGDTNVVYFSLSADDYLIKGQSESSVSSLHMNQTQFGMATFHLFIESNGITNTDVSLDGLDTANTSATENKNGATITLHDKEPLSGDGAYYDKTWTVFQGKVTGSGKWKGLPPG